MLKLGAAAIILALLLAEGALSPGALAGGLAIVLAAVVFAERTLIAPSVVGINAAIVVAGDG